jgi:hypothetical protein
MRTVVMFSVLVLVFVLVLRLSLPLVHQRVNLFDAIVVVVVRVLGMVMRMLSMVVFVLVFVAHVYLTTIQPQTALAFCHEDHQARARLPRIARGRAAHPD